MEIGSKLHVNGFLVVFSGAKVTIFENEAPISYIRQIAIARYLMDEGFIEKGTAEIRVARLT